MGKDLGTYHLRVEFEDGTGFIEAWNTGCRYVGGGTAHVQRLDGKRVDPPYDNEADLFHAMCYQHTDGNFSCDCNKRLLLARAYNQPELNDYPCGDEIVTKRLTAIRPDGGEVVIYSTEITK